ncbi:MAG: hypothetical protein IPO92_09285 [Saprospiraceae bacterium]|nr:hypothetical protein [Saprospiraceae bacterium]
MNESFELIYNDLSMESHTGATEAEMLDVIADRVEYFLKYDKDLLVSYLYRLDIEEKNIDHAIAESMDDPLHIVLAKLILIRQKQRLETKSKYKVEPIEGWEY